MDDSQIDLDEARRFLQILDPSADMRSLLEDNVADGFVFQTFDDIKGRKDRSLARVIIGTLEDNLTQLADLNKRGAGIFVTVNETDNKGRKLDNLTRIRAVWIEDDEGHNLKTPIDPHIVTETSPGKFHKIFLVDGLSVEQHAAVQEVLITEYGSDPNAKDAVRVLRPAGFMHNKKSPFKVRLIHESGELPYSAEELLAAFKPNPANVKFPLTRGSSSSTKPKTSTAKKTSDSYSPLSEDDRLPLPDITIENCKKYLPEPGDQSYNEWRDVGLALHHQFGGSPEGLLIFDEWSQGVREYLGYEDVEKAWKGFGSRTDNSVITFRSLIDSHNKKEKQKRAALASSAVLKANKLLEKCQDYTTLMGDVAPQLWSLANTNVALENEFRDALIARYEELNPGHSLTKTEATRALKTRRMQNRKRAEATVDLNIPECPDWASGWVWISEEECFYHFDSRSRLSNNGFKAHYDSQLPVGEGAPTDSAKYLRDNNLIPKVMRSMYAPMYSTIFEFESVPHVNTYSAKSRPVVPEVPTDTEAVEIFKKHVSNVCGGWGREAHILCNWIADATAEIPRKIRWSPLLIGGYGDGKSVFYSMFEIALGLNNVRTLNGQSIVVSASSGQTGWAEGTAICFIEELKFHGHNRYDAYNLLKPYISNTTVALKKLYREIRNILNTQNYFAVSNYHDCVPIEDTDRRMYVLSNKINLPELNKTEPEYFTKLFRVVESVEGVTQVLSWLRSLPKHEEYDPDKPAPMTEDKKTVIRLVRDDLTEELEGILEDSNDPFYGNEIISFTPLFNAVMLRSNGALKANEKFKLRKALQDLGFTKLDRYRLHAEYNGDNRHALWAKKSVYGSDVEKVKNDFMERYQRLASSDLSMDDLI